MHDGLHRLTAAVLCAMAAGACGQLVGGSAVVQDLLGGFDPFPATTTSSAGAPTTSTAAPAGSAFGVHPAAGTGTAAAGSGPAGTLLPSFSDSLWGETSAFAAAGAATAPAALQPQAAPAASQGWATFD